ncbi:MAG: biotin/lipoyl-binding protein, partial [Cyanobacteriota bacterium]
MLYKNFVFKISFILLLLLSTSCAKKIIEDKPVRKNITETVFASGVLVPDNQYNLTSLSDGYIIKLDFEEGDMVKKGNLLAVIENEQSNINAKSSKQLLSIATSNASSNSPALKQINTNIEMAKQKIKQDERQVERYKNLFEVNSIPKLEYENSLLALENSKTNLASLQENYLLIKQQADQQLIIQKSQSELSDS